jgi:UDP-2,3-diacylglucosamine pyrophosphatase LpxH
MSRSRRLTAIFESATEIPFDDSSQFVFFSDCHRGDGSWADDFAHNQNVFYHALSRYYQEGYIYIEIGDGDELWENFRFDEIRQMYSNIFKLLRKFYTENRLYLIYGNHDKERKDLKTVKQTLYHYYDEKSGERIPLFDGIRVHGGLVLRYIPTGNTIFLAHGHQGDLINDHLWKLGKFLGRWFWRPLQLLGVHDLTRPAINSKKRKKVERKILRWVETHKQTFISGHTHRPRFPSPGAAPYFNDGSCVHPRSITGIEIKKGEILLVKWGLSTREDGALLISKDILAGPQKLSLYFSASNARA